MTAPFTLDFAPAAAPDDPLATPEQWEASMAEIADFTIAELTAAGLAAPDARRLGCRVAVRLCRELGGTRYYWPRGDALERAVRDLALWAAHDGTVDGPHGVRALARAHHVSDVHVWRIIARQRELHRQRVQLPLPGLEGGEE